MYDWLAELRPAHRVLDLASGGGSYEYRLFPCSSVGLDEDSDAFPKSAGENLRVVGRSHRLPFRDAVFDLVICHHALEHVAELDATLDEVRRVLKPDGRFYLSVPDGHSLSDAVYRFVYEGGGHVQRYRFGELRSEVERRTGLRLEKWQKLYSSFSYLRWLASLAESGAPDGLGRRTGWIVRFPAGVIRLAQFLLHCGARASDRFFGTSLSLYGWAMYFAPGNAEVVEIPGYFNVCLTCGSGHPVSELGRVRRVCYRCPACHRLNPYFPPPRDSNTVAATLFS